MISPDIREELREIAKELETQKSVGKSGTEGLEPGEPGR